VTLYSAFSHELNLREREKGGRGRAMEREIKRETTRERKGLYREI